MKNLFIAVRPRIHPAKSSYHLRVQPNFFVSIGKCKDKLSEDKCMAILEGDKCDTKLGKKCMKTCELCDDEGGDSGSGEIILIR